MDINIWKQTIEDISCSTHSTCNSRCPGIYKPGLHVNIGKCCTYDILTAICLTIAPVVDVENVEESWEYRGGCFENGSPVLYERA